MRFWDKIEISLDAVGFCCCFCFNISKTKHWYVKNPDGVWYREGDFAERYYFLFTAQRLQQSIFYSLKFLFIHPSYFPEIFSLRFQTKLLRKKLWIKFCVNMSMFASRICCSNLPERRTKLFVTSDACQCHWTFIEVYQILLLSLVSVSLTQIS